MKMVPELERCPRDSQISSLRDQCLLLMSWLSGKTGSYQFSSVAQSCPAPCEPMDCSTPGLLVHHPCPNSWSLPKLISIESVMPSNHLILCRPLLLLPSNLSQHQGSYNSWKLRNFPVLQMNTFQLWYIFRKGLCSSLPSLWIMPIVNFSNHTKAKVYTATDFQKNLGEIVACDN